MLHHRSLGDGNAATVEFISSKVEHQKAFYLSELELKQQSLLYSVTATGSHVNRLLHI